MKRKLIVKLHQSIKELDLTPLTRKWDEYDSDTSDREVSKVNDMIYEIKSSINSTDMDKYKKRDLLSSLDKLYNNIWTTQRRIKGSLGYHVISKDDVNGYRLWLLNVVTESGPLDGLSFIVPSEYELEKSKYDRRMQNIDDEINNYRTNPIFANDKKAKDSIKYLEKEREKLFDEMTSTLSRLNAKSYT